MLIVKYNLAISELISNDSGESTDFTLSLRITIYLISNS